MMHRRATRIRRTAVLEVSTIARNIPSLRVVVTPKDLMPIHSSSNESLAPKTLPPAPNPFDTTLPTIHHSNIRLQARRRIPDEVTFSRTYHTGFNLGLTRIPFSSRRELHRLGYDDAEASMLGMVVQTLLQCLNKSSHETHPIFPPKPHCIPYRPHGSSFQHFLPRNSQLRQRQEPTHTTICPPIATSLLRVDDPSATSLITIPESTVITRSYAFLPSRPIPSQTSFFLPIPPRFNSPYAHAAAPIKCTRGQRGNAFRVRLRRVAETRDPAYRIVEIESNLFFIPDMLFGLAHSSQTEVVALVEPDIKAFRASFAIAGQDEDVAYRIVEKTVTSVQDA
ncbi:hypothetical protein M422DRAFT_256712 [Sphaerobolus stellatus SS14]|uniref:Uncharacterized protein n=1 Tax=Sphaerobolus stellatus (strain SS14) TaxID=990650 RepID=A0A0C9UBD1_SPHS4|nr:hypothetical protein M422DRAFT_256712 [Sphaerobolus stellatus SS14]